MKSQTFVETTIKVELNVQDLGEFVKSHDLAPKDWKFYSIEVIGKGLSNGAELIIKHTQASKP